jgi:hypothetical protein
MGVPSVLKRIALIVVAVFFAAVVLSFVVIIAATTGSHSVHWTRHGAVSTTSVSPWVIWPLVVVLIFGAALIRHWWRSRHS